MPVLLRADKNVCPTSYVLPSVRPGGGADDQEGEVVLAGMSAGEVLHGAGERKRAPVAAELATR